MSVGQGILQFRVGANPTGSQATVLNRYVYTASATPTLPRGIYQFFIQGAGAGAQRFNNNVTNTSTPGGGAGVYRTDLIAYLDGFTPITITVGAGGSGATTPGSSGTDGGNSSVIGTGINSVAQGGNGGDVTLILSGTGMSGSGGGSSSGTARLGAAAGGFNSANPISNYPNVTLSTGAAGGTTSGIYIGGNGGASSIFGVGGAGGNGNSAGTATAGSNAPATSYGAGGGAGGNGSSTSGNGGNGANGIVIAVRLSDYRDL